MDNVRDQELFVIYLLTALAVLQVHNGAIHKLLLQYGDNLYSQNRPPPNQSILNKRPLSARAEVKPAYSDVDFMLLGAIAWKRSTSNRGIMYAMQNVYQPTRTKTIQRVILC